MKRLAIVAAFAGIALTAYPKIGYSNAADPTPPRPPDKFKSLPFKITADPKSKENRLLIPSKFLENNRAAAVGFLGNGGGNLRTVIAGVAISLSLVSLVFLVIQKKNRLAQAMALFVAVGGAGFIWVDNARADIAPPISEIPQAWKDVADGKKKVTIEITDKGEAVELVLGTYFRSTPVPEERRGPRKPSGFGDGAIENGAAPK